MLTVFFLMLFKAIRAFVSFSKGNIREYVRIFSLFLSLICSLRERENL